MDKMSRAPIAFNMHQWQVTPESFLRNNILSRELRIIATNVDRSGREFISIAEGVRYPIYATQFHPEKNLFEWDSNLAIPHTQDARDTAQYFANFFIDQCRSNNHTFGGPRQENDVLIYSYEALFSAPRDPSFEQVYLFPADAASPSNHLTRSLASSVVAM